VQFLVSAAQQRLAKSFERGILGLLFPQKNCRLVVDLCIRDCVLSPLGGQDFKMRVHRMSSK
jgi:hypothetical protein